jgi:DNA-binding NarL/FixJ family response regulator
VRVVVANVLAVGVTEKSQALNELPIRLLLMETGAEAIECLQKERIASVITRWKLIDMPQGKFLQKIRAAKPWIPTIAFVTPGDPSQEMAARRLGVSAVLNQDIDDEFFRETVCQLLGIYTLAGMRTQEGYRVTIDNME